MAEIQQSLDQNSLLISEDKNHDPVLIYPDLKKTGIVSSTLKENIWKPWDREMTGCIIAFWAYV